jgi:predicted nucleotidyltransferase
MRCVGFDTEGYIEICCAVEKISTTFLPVLEGSIALLKSTFQTRLHSIYLYGSIATGQAVLKQSDIDLLIIFSGPLSESDHAEIKYVAHSLSASHQSLVREVGLAVVSLEEALAKESLSGFGCFIKHLCVCVDGEDIRPLFPKFRPSIEVARGFNGDYAAVMKARFEELAKMDHSKMAQPVIRQICRKTVRTGFSLVMPRMGCWTTDLKPSFDYFCRYYPDKRSDMALGLEQK